MELRHLYTTESPKRIEKASFCQGLGPHNAMLDIIGKVFGRAMTTAELESL